MFLLCTYIDLVWCGIMVSKAPHFGERLHGECDGEQLSSGYPAENTSPWGDLISRHHIPGAPFPYRVHVSAGWSRDPRAPSATIGSKGDTISLRRYCVFLMQIVKSHRRFVISIWVLLVFTIVTTFVAELLWGLQATPLQKAVSRRCGAGAVLPAAMAANMDIDQRRTTQAA